MIVTAIATRLVQANTLKIIDLLDESIQKLSDHSVVAISSKVISLCEGRVVPIGSIDKNKLIRQEADYYLASNLHAIDYYFTLTNNTLIPISGIDESNTDGYYVLWPSDPQTTANNIRAHLAKRFSLKNIGVIITDSTVTPLRYGTQGITLAHSGFLAANDYIGKPDLFGRPLEVTQSSVAGGLAAAANLAMGEGSEQTPIVVVGDISFVTFQPHNPTKHELESFYIQDKDEDLFAPFLNSVTWHKGSQS